MKKRTIFSVLLLLALLIWPVSLGENLPNIDLSALTIEELTTLKSDITKEMVRRTLMTDTSVSTTPQVILFRESPWFSSETEMLKILKPLGYDYYTHGEGEGYTEIGSWEINLNNSYTLEDHIIKNREIGYWVGFSLDNIKVAGFTVRYISMDFLYGLDDNHVYRDSSNSRMISATYLFSVAEPSEAYEVLLAKLTSLYGEPIVVETASGSYLYRHAVWYGLDNTAVRLDMKYRDSEHYDLQICYGISNSTELISELQTAITNEIILEGSMDGL